MFGLHERPLTYQWPVYNVNVKSYIIIIFFLLLLLYLKILIILMHLQMQRDVWLDNFINLRQYFLRYTVGNPTSSRNVAFNWLTSEYMQLASGFVQLAAAGR